MARTWILPVLLAGVVAGCGDEGCPTGYIDCGLGCVDVLNDTSNCGGCGSICGPGLVCVSGTCTLSCQDGYENCDGVCRDIMSDNYNCGSCGLACAPGYVCVDASCTPDCPDGYTNCSGVCKNLSNDPSNCGDCANACAAGEVCGGGSCLFECPGDYVDCSGSCADLMTDPGHCGACGTACLGGQICVDGSCTPSCYEGLILCSGACVDPQRDPDNCGSCGFSCGTDDVCHDGTCMAACPGGFVDCSGSCRDLNSDRMNCGACETECLIGERCNSGVCEVTCEAPLVNCSGECSDTSMDPENCGACGAACGLREACVSGSCLPAIIHGPSLGEVRGATAIMDTYMSASPYLSKHDGGMVYSIRENAIYSIYGNDNQGRNVYRIDHIAGTSSLVATLTYNRHGSYPVIDDIGGYVYFPPSQSGPQMERMVVGGSHTVATMASAPNSATFHHGTWKNGKLWIVLNDYYLYQWDPSTDTWTRLISYGNRAMCIAHNNDASDLIYVWVVGGTFWSYDTVTGTNTSLAGFPVSASLGGNGQIEWIPSAEGVTMGFIYAVSGCSGSPRLYSIYDDAWYTLTDAKDNGNCNGHATFDSILMRLYITDATNNIWYYQY